MTLSLEFISSSKICQEVLTTPAFLDFPGGSVGKEFACNAGDLGLIPGLGRSPGEGKGYPLQYSGLENSMDCIVHGLKESDTTEQLSRSLTITWMFFLWAIGRSGADYSLILFYRVHLFMACILLQPWRSSHANEIHFDSYRSLPRNLINIFFPSIFIPVKCFIPVNMLFRVCTISNVFFSHLPDFLVGQGSLYISKSLLMNAMQLLGLSF